MRDLLSLSVLRNMLITYTLLYILIIMHNYIYILNRYNTAYDIGRPPSYPSPLPVLVAILTRRNTIIALNIEYTLMDRCMGIRLFFNTLNYFFPMLLFG